MLFNYEAISSGGEKKRGTVDAGSKDLAISAIQRRGLIVVSVTEGEGKKGLNGGRKQSTNFRLGTLDVGSDDLRGRRGHR